MEKRLKSSEREAFRLIEESTAELKVLNVEFDRCPTCGAPLLNHSHYEDALEALAGITKGST